MKHWSKIIAHDNRTKVLSMAETVRGIKNIFLLLTGFLTCPCHLPFLLPALAALLAGTAVGTFIADNTGLLIALATIYFVGVVVYFLSRDKRRGSQRLSRAMERSRE